MADGDFDFNAFEPSFLEDGYGISGPQEDATDEDLQDWDTNAWSDNSQAVEDFTGTGSGGITVQTGPFSGGYTGTVTGVTTITLDERYFLIQDNGGGEVLISINTCDAACP